MVPVQAQAAQAAQVNKVLTITWSYQCDSLDQSTLILRKTQIPAHLFALYESKMRTPVNSEMTMIIYKKRPCARSPQSVAKTRIRPLLKSEVFSLLIKTDLTPNT